MVRYAAVKNNTIGAVIYTGVPLERYPKWFREDVLMGLRYDTFGQAHYMLTDETDDVQESIALIPYKSVFLRNKHGDIRCVDFEIYKREYFDMGLYAAVHKSDCIEYFLWDSTIKMMTGLPEWVVEMVHFDEIHPEYGGWTFYDYENGEIAMSQMCYLVRNKFGEIRYMEPEVFDKYFDKPFPEYL